MQVLMILHYRGARQPYKQIRTLNTLAERDEFVDLVEKIKSRKRDDIVHWEFYVIKPTHSEELLAQLKEIS